MMIIPLSTTNNTSFYAKKQRLTTCMQYATMLSIEKVVQLTTFKKKGGKCLQPANT